VTAFNHVSVTCADLDRSLAFYHGLVGLPILDQGEVASADHRAIIGLGDVRMRFAELDLGGGFLELFEYLEPRGTPAASRTCDPGNAHFALTVDDAEAVYQRLTGAGVTTRSAPVTLSGGAWRGARAFYSLDPDGVTVEFIEFPSPADG
jgi:catechol 2,3-dioxygenase-like lactoylglutathione lyase family enzyme